MKLLIDHCPLEEKNIKAKRKNTKNLMMITLIIHITTKELM